MQPAVRSRWKPSFVGVVGVLLCGIMLTGGVIVVVQFVQKQQLIGRLEEAGGDYAHLMSHSNAGDILIEDGNVVHFDATVQDEDFEVLHHDLRVLSRLQLDLQETPISDRTLKLLDGATNIMSLNLEGTLITDNGLRYVATMENLVELNLCNCRITDKGLAELRELTNLRYLYMTGTLITDEGLPTLGALSALRRVSIGWGPVTPAGADVLRELLPQTDVLRAGPPFADRLADVRVTEANGNPLPEDGGPWVAVCRQYFAALHQRDLFTMKSLWSRSVRVSFKTVEDDVLEIRPTRVEQFSGYANDDAATVSVVGPVPEGYDVQYDVQMVREDDGQWRIVQLSMVF